MIELLIWIAFCNIDGVADGFLYHLKHPDRTVKPNEHALLWTRRFVVGGGLLILSGSSIVTVLVFMAVQPFFHNNAYYNTRHYLDKINYAYGLWSHSEESTAWTTKYLTPWVRIVLLIVGMALHVINEMI